MIKKNINVIIQVICLCLFCFMAAASASQQSAGSGSYWSEMGRAALVGAGAGHDGYVFIGVESSESEARELAASKGYSRYIWDSKNGNVYGK